MNVGYHGWSNKILKSVNGHEPKNIQELAEVIVRKVTGEMIEFRCQTVGLADADFGEICNTIVSVFFLTKDTISLESLLFIVDFDMKLFV